MDYSQRLAISYYKTIATLNDAHKVYLVQHQETKKIYVTKVLDVYNKDIYVHISKEPINGIPQIVALYEEENHLIVIENYVSGHSLAEMIVSSSITIDSIYQYMFELCSILEELHSFQPPIIHRDIKPSNIIITEYNHVILLDFNAAKYFTQSENADTVLLGTKGYAAPEQYGFGSSTPRTDIYALGILLKELTSTLPSYPTALDDIMAKCIQINPEDRYQSVTALKSALEQAKHPKDLKNNTSWSIHSLLPPGYRTLTLWKMIVASVLYSIIFVGGLSLQVENTFGAALWVNRIFCILILLSVVFVCFNYLDIQRLFPMCKHESKILRYTGIIFLNIMIVALLAIIMFVVQTIFSV